MLASVVGPVDGFDGEFGKRSETRVDSPLLSQRIESLLGVPYLVFRAAPGCSVPRISFDVTGNLDQHSSNCPAVDVLRVITRVREAEGCLHDAFQVVGPSHLLHRIVTFEECSQGDWRCILATLNSLYDGLEDATVQRVVEMLRPEILRYAVDHFVGYEECAQQRLLRLYVPEAAQVG